MTETAICIVFCPCAVDSPAPDAAEEVVVHSGPDYIIIDWEREDKGDEGEGGWEAEYTITIIPVNKGQAPNENGTGNGTLGSARVMTLTTSSQPPVKVAGLDPETDYEVLVETRLGPHFTSTVRVDDVQTTANDSRMPREIIGVRSLFVSYCFNSQELIL